MTLRVKQWLVISLFLITCSFSVEAENFELREFIAEYQAYYDSHEVGKASLRLAHLDDNQYQLLYESKVSKFFLSDKRFEESIFTVQDHALQPLVYHYKRSGTGRNKKLNLEFNSLDKHVIINGETLHEWQGELDNQLFRLDVSRRLADKQKEITYDFFNYRGEKRQYQLEVQETEKLALPYGEIDAIKVKINRESNKRVTFAWFAPSLNYTLVRLQQFKDGSEQGDMRLKNFILPTD